MSDQDDRPRVEIGEGKDVEFKATLRYDIKQGRANKDLQKVVAKAIAGFLNSNGGTLFVGVSDSGAALGLDLDLGTLERQTIDGFEQAFRNAVGHHLGVEVSAHILIDFVDVGGITIAKASCDRFPVPVFFRDADRCEFYIRDGNTTKPLDVQTTHAYIKRHFAEPEDLATIVRSAVRRELAQVRAPAAPSMAHPSWLEVATRKVIDTFLVRLLQSHGWQKLYIVSPWLSALTSDCSMTLDGIVKRLKEDSATVYVVTRQPDPDEPWHQQAIDLLGESGRANIALVPELHAKLYTAKTDSGAFALLGSANFTQQSLISKEIGVLANAYREGQSVVSRLEHEAAMIYRSKNRKLAYQVNLQT